MEKDSKLKSIESANQKLLDASKEFKQIKDEYLSGQNGLKSDLSSVTSLLEEHSSVLIEKYKEHEEIINTISELEYEHDRSKIKKIKRGRRSRGISISCKDCFPLSSETRGRKRKLRSGYRQPRVYYY